MGWSGTRVRQRFTQALPNPGFNSARTLTVLPQASIGAWIGIWTVLPEMKPGDWEEWLLAPESAKAGAAPPSARMAPATTAALFFMNFPFSAVMPLRRPKPSEHSLNGSRIDRQL